MHQEHNLPWNAFVSNFNYVHEDKRFTPARTGYIPLGRPNQANELDHFVRRMVSVIREFSTTERAKYPPPTRLPPPDDGNLFSDHLRDKYPDYLNSQNQKLSNWIHKAQADYIGNPGYNAAHGDFADVVKILIHENQMETLLMLANHPLVPLHQLRNLSWGHHFGVHRIVEAALSPYIFWNFMAASGRLASGGYRNDTYRRLVRDVTQTMDYCAQQIPHWDFYGVRMSLGSEDDLPEVDHTRLHEYLKHLFSLMYRYDVVMTECGEEG